jgi:hypothetical protein
MLSDSMEVTEKYVQGHIALHAIAERAATHAIVRRVISCVIDPINAVVDIFSIVSLRSHYGRWRHTTIVAIALEQFPGLIISKKESFPAPDCTLLIGKD